MKYRIIKERGWYWIESRILLVFWYRMGLPFKTLEQAEKELNSELQLNKDKFKVIKYIN